MNERDKKMLMASVAYDTKMDLKNKLKQYKLIIQDENFFDYELLKIALDRQDNSAIFDVLLKFGCRIKNPNKINSEEILLHRAVKLCNDSIIRKLLIYGASIYDKDENWETAIHAGFKDGYHDSVNTVLNFYYLKLFMYVQTQHLRSFKDPDPTNKDDILHFHIACILNNLCVVKHFLKYGFDINSLLSVDSPESSGFNPLHYAAIMGHYDMFSFLLKNGADLTIRNCDGLTASHICYYSGDMGNLMMRSIFELGNDTKFINSVDSNEVSQFHLCCMTSCLDYVKFFINTGVDINSAVSLNSPKNPGFTPLHFAVMNGCDSVVNLLLQNGADCNKVDKEGTTPFHLACNLDPHKAVYIIKILLTHNTCADAVNSAVFLSSSTNPGFTPLHFAVINGHDTVVKLLLENGADCNKVDKEGTTPLHLACGLVSDKARVIIQLLLNYNARVDAVNEKGCTPLHMAFYSNKYENTIILDILISRIPQDINFTDDQGLSHFHIICTRNINRRVEDFLKSGVAVDTSVMSGIYAGYTALHFAALHNQKDVVILLLKWNAQVNVKTNELVTPLHFACECNYTKAEEIYNHYIYAKIKERMNDKKPVTASKMFKRKNQFDIVKLLIHHGAFVEARDFNGLTPLLYMFSLCLRDFPDQLYQGSYFMEENTLKNVIYSRLQKITKILILNNADINARTVVDKTIWNFISENRWLRNSEKLIDFLIAMGAEIQSVDWD